MADWPGILKQTDQLIELSERKLRTLRELRFALAVAAQVGDAKAIRCTGRSEADLPRGVSVGGYGFRYPYLTPWEHVVTRVKRKDSDDWQTLDPFLDRRTGLPVAQKPARKSRA